MIIYQLILVLLISYVPVFGQANWNQLIQAIQTKSMNRHSRTISKQQQYQNHKLNLKQKNLTLATYVKQSIFGFTQQSKYPIYQLTNINKKHDNPNLFLTIDDITHVLWIKQQHIIGNQATRRRLEQTKMFLLLAKNDYPYNLQDGIQHWLIWSNGQLSLQLVKQQIENIIKPQYEYLAYINQPNHKSIPEIFHVQVFINKRDNEDQL